MSNIRPEQGLERLLGALIADVLDAPDEEILSVADELGQKPAMKGSIALAGITFVVRPQAHADEPHRHGKEQTAGKRRLRGLRRGSKGDTRSSD